MIENIPQSFDALAVKKKANGMLIDVTKNVHLQKIPQNINILEIGTALVLQQFL